MIFCHPSSLTLPPLLDPWGRTRPFMEESEIWESGSDKEELRERVCHELFMTFSFWCLTFHSKALSLTIASKNFLLSTSLSVIKRKKKKN